MGISGLLPVLKSITENKPLHEYKGRTLAIDGYCWLHRAIYSCSQEICLGQETDKYVTYFMDRIGTLLHNGVTPYVVFDGGPLPMKKGTEEERRKVRQKNRELGIQHHHNRNFSEARKCFSRAADVSPYMAHRVIQHLKAQNVLYVVAPYEADSQLAYLIKNGLADGVITEDSDCLPFGCHTVLFKMDRDNVAQEIQTANLKKNKGLRFHMFTEQMFLEMCIFSGCDYLPSIPGFGLKKAYTAMKQHGSFTKVIRALRLEGKVRIPAGYEDDFKKSLLTFRHQRVYCPKAQKLVPLTPIPANLASADDGMDFLGPMLSDGVARAIAEGDMDPITTTRFPDPAPLKRPLGQSWIARPTPRITMVATPPKRKVGITAFFSSNSSESSWTHSSTRSSPLPNQRKLPESFLQQPKATPAKRLMPMSERFSSSPAASVKTTSPLVSRFFSRTPKKMSPPDESEKKSDSTAAEDSFESQEPCEVDVARNISFDPLEKKRKHSVLDAKAAGKENHSPSPERKSISSTPVVKETAFSRMMRAGSMLQKHKLKKQKTAGLGFRGGKLRTTPKQQTPLSHRIGEYALHGNVATQPSPTVASFCTQTAEDNDELELQTEVTVKEDSTVNKSFVGEIKKPTADSSAVGTTRARETVVATASSSTASSFARFRFQR